MNSDSNIVASNAFFLELCIALCNLTQPVEILEASCKKLAQFIEADQIAYVDINLEKGTAFIDHDWNNGKIGSNAGCHKLEDFGPFFIDDLKAGKIIVSNDVSKDSRTASKDFLKTFEKISVAAFVNIPLIKNGDLVAVLAVHSKYPKIWSPESVRHATYAAEQTWVTLENAKVEKALKRSEARLREIFDKIDEGYCLCELVQDKDGKAIDYKFLEVNSYFEKMTGLSQATGHNAYSLIPDLEKDWLEIYSKVALEGQTIRFENSSYALNRVFDVFATPSSPAGRFILVFRDITSRKTAEDLIANSYNIYLNLIKNNPFGVYLIDSDFKMAQFSAGASKSFQNISHLIGKDFAELVHLIWTDPFASELIRLFRHTLATGESYQTSDTTERRADTKAIESYEWKIERVTLPDGQFGVICYFYNTSHQKQYEQHIQLLLREVNHRSKNLLGVVLSVARQTVANNPKDFLSRFEARVQALSSAQDILVKNEWKNVSVEELVYAQLSHFKDLLGTRIKTVGPLTKVSSAAAQTLGMAFHELSTNASKYGALSNSHGIVEISWDIYYDEQGDKKFAISWMESGGPDVYPPNHHGFGSTIIYKMAKVGLNADVNMDFEKSGLNWQLQCSFKNISPKDMLN